MIWEGKLAYLEIGWPDHSSVRILPKKSVALNLVGTYADRGVMEHSAVYRKSGATDF